MTITAENRNGWNETLPGPHCPPEIPHELPFIEVKSLLT